MGHPLLHAILSFALVQAPPPSVGGTIRDGDSRRPLAGAAVALSDLSRATTADAVGRYALADVPSGPQHITVRFLGYEPRVLHVLVPREGSVEINVALRPAPHRLQPIEVRPPLALRGGEDAAAAYPDRSASAFAIRHHPSSAEPDAFQALGGGEVALRPESPTGLHVRGGGSDQIGYELDGVPVLSPYHGGGVFSAWNPDALAGLGLSATGASAGAADALSGTVAGVTRAPGSRVRTQGSFSTTQGRLTADGPLGPRGAGWLASGRTGFPSGLLAPGDDPSFLRGRSADWLVAVRAPLLGGGLRLLAYDNDNAIHTAASAGPELTDAGRRNRFAWHGRSVGGEWRRAWRGGAIRVRGWEASLESGAAWAGRSEGLVLGSARRDAGALAAVERSAGSAVTEVGLRIERIRTAYRIAGDSTASVWQREGATPLASLFARHARDLDRRIALELAATGTMATGRPRLDPSARLRWQVSPRMTLTASARRRHQYAQSLRNPESVVGNVFPADLFLGSGAGAPVARADQAVLALELRPSPGVRVGAQAWTRAFRGLLLAAPAAAEPFATAGFVTGPGRAHGLALDLSVSGTRYAVMASYGLQDVRLGGGSGGYVPEFATAHLFEAGMLVFPTTTSSIRLGLTGGAGRRATSPTGPLEWESCNLRDRGCELAGSPHYDAAALGGARLPAYLRLDLGVRQHWHVAVGGRDAVLGLFGTMTNLLGRTNILTYARDPLTGGGGAIDMRPRSPLVVGLDWQF